MTGAVCYCAALRKATRRVTALYDEALIAHGLTLAQFSLLRHIRRHGPVSLTELGTRMELDRSTVGRNVRVVEKAGLVRPAETSDQREAAIELTDNGKQILTAAEVEWAKVQGAIEAKLGASGVGELLGVLSAL